MIHQGSNISHQTEKKDYKRKIIASPHRCLLQEGIWTRSVKGGYPPNIPPFNIKTSASEEANEAKASFMAV